MSTNAGAISATEIPRLVPVAHTSHLASLCTAAEKLLDFIAVLGGVYVADALYQILKPQRAAAYAAGTVYFWAAAFALLFVFLLERHGGYRPSMSLLGIRETERILRVTLHGLLLAVLAAYFFAAPIPRLAFCLAATTVPLSLTDGEVGDAQNSADGSQQGIGLTSCHHPGNRAGGKASVLGPGALSEIRS